MEDALLIDWTSDASVALLNPRMPEEEQRRLEALVPDLPAHVWLATSGTGGRLKLAGLSKRAILASAAAVNRHLESHASDRWCCPLPTFHVGGLGIHARAFLSGAEVVTIRWDPHRFAGLPGVTLASLVPAQVSDLVATGLEAPAQLRAIVVGGGALGHALYKRAHALGWPVLPSYGMTECASQVATARPGSEELLLLDHVAARTEPDGRLALRSEALLTGYVAEEGLVDPKVDGWFVTEDLGSVEGRALRIEGRRGEVIKIGGETVDLGRLDQILAEIEREAAVVAVPDERLGSVIVLAVASGDPDAVAATFNARVLPFERARRAVGVAGIPRTELGKLIRGKLAEWVV